MFKSKMKIGSKTLSDKVCNSGKQMLSVKILKSTVVMEKQKEYQMARDYWMKSLMGTLQEDKFANKR